MCNQYILTRYPTGKKCQGIGWQRGAGNADPFKYLPRDQSLLALGDVLVLRLLPGRGSGGKAGDREDIFAAAVKKPYGAHPRGWRLLGGNWNGQILAGYQLGPHFRKRCCLYKLDLTSKQNKTQKTKRSRKFYTKKGTPMKQSVAHCICEVSQLLLTLVSPTAISLQGHHGVGATPQSSCPHSAGSSSRRLSYTDRGCRRAPCSPSAPSPETCWPLR